MREVIEIRPGEYHDSVRLMQASQSVRAVPGVLDVMAAMATELNLGLITEMGFDVSSVAGAGPDDLLVAIRAEHGEVLDVARLALQEALSARPSPGHGPDTPRPRTIGSAADAVGANVAVISVPGGHAGVEAAEALERGLHVMIFSDNVPLDEEIRLKRRAAQLGLLVMGPDCGTAVVSGVGLGFANAVEPGPVGIVGASGTGIQQLCCLLDEAGVGVRHALGTGSRDLSHPVGGASTLRGLQALDEDPSVDVIAVVSKPPDPEVAREVRTAAARLDTPVVEVFMGETTLEAGAAEVLERLGIPAPVYRHWPAPVPDHRPGRVVGLFSGGTLRDEARFVAGRVLGDISTTEGAAGHVFVDYGDDAYTRARAHPMIDQTVRLERLHDAIGDESVGTILLDVVLGYAAHPDPAHELAPLIARAREAGVASVVSLCGTAHDPQGREAQASALNGAAASVWLSNAAAAEEAARLAREGAE